jgi:thioredoxin reductase
LPLADAFSKYPKESYEIVIGAATASDFAAKTVTVTPEAGGAPRTLQYDQLVLATGSRTAGSDDLPWKAVGSVEQLRAGLKSWQERVAAAKHIVVAGAGSTGAEVAAELGSEFGRAAGDAKKEILLVSGDAEVLHGDKIAGSARSELKNLNVQVRTGVRVERTATRADGKTDVVLAGGETIVTDLYLPTFGLLPNTEYIDVKYLTPRKTVVVDEFLRVKGLENVWAAGDVISEPRAGFIITQTQVSPFPRPSSTSVNFLLRLTKFAILGWQRWPQHRPGPQRQAAIGRQESHGRLRRGYGAEAGRRTHGIHPDVVHHGVAGQGQDARDEYDGGLYEWQRRLIFALASFWAQVDDGEGALPLVCRS